VNSNQIAGSIAIALGIVQIVFASKVARINVAVATRQGGMAQKVFGNPRTAPRISIGMGILFVLTGVYGLFCRGIRIGSWPSTYV
jgi:hypothetical protein